jgi:hypothetical protein
MYKLPDYTAVLKQVFSNITLHTLSLIAELFLASHNEYRNTLLPMVCPEYKIDRQTVYCNYKKDNNSRMCF